MPSVCSETALEQEQREEVPALVSDQPPQQPVAVPGGHRRGHRDRPKGDVGVGALLVGVGVVAGVLALPPAVADSHQQVRDDHADPVVPAAGLEHLPVCGVVAEKGDLGHGDSRAQRRWPVATRSRRSI